MTDEELVKALRKYFFAHSLDGKYPALIVADRIEALKAERDRMREALEPFAVMADHIKPDKPGPLFAFNGAVIGREDLFRARAALTPAKEDRPK